MEELSEALGYLTNGEQIEFDKIRDFFLKTPIIHRKGKDALKVRLHSTELHLSSVVEVILFFGPPKILELYFECLNKKKENGLWKERPKSQIWPIIENNFRVLFNAMLKISESKYVGIVSDEIKVLYYYLVSNCAPFVDVNLILDYILSVDDAEFFAYIIKTKIIPNINLALMTELVKLGLVKCMTVALIFCEIGYSNFTKSEGLYLCGELNKQYGTNLGYWEDKTKTQIHNSKMRVKNEIELEDVDFKFNFDFTSNEPINGTEESIEFDEVDNFLFKPGDYFKFETIKKTGNGKKGEDLMLSLRVVCLHEMNETLSNRWPSVSRLIQEDAPDMFSLQSEESHLLKVQVESDFITPAGLYLFLCTLMPEIEIKTSEHSYYNHKVIETEGNKEDDYGNMKYGDQKMLQRHEINTNKKSSSVSKFINHPLRSTHQTPNPSNPKLVTEFIHSEGPEYFKNTPHSFVNNTEAKFGLGSPLFMMLINSHKPVVKEVLMGYLKDIGFPELSVDFTETGITPSVSLFSHTLLDILNWYHEQVIEHHHSKRIMKAFDTQRFISGTCAIIESLCSNGKGVLLFFKSVKHQYGSGDSNVRDKKIEGENKQKFVTFLMSQFPPLLLSPFCEKEELIKTFDAFVTGSQNDEAQNGNNEVFSLSFVREIGLKEKLEEDSVLKSVVQIALELDSWKIIHHLMAGLNGNLLLYYRFGEIEFNLGKRWFLNRTNEFGIHHHYPIPAIAFHHSMATSISSLSKEDLFNANNISSATQFILQIINHNSISIGLKLIHHFKFLDFNNPIDLAKTASQIIQFTKRLVDSKLEVVMKKMEDHYNEEKDKPRLILGPDEEDKLSKYFKILVSQINLAAIFVLTIVKHLKANVKEEIFAADDWLEDEFKTLDHTISSDFFSYAFFSFGLELNRKPIHTNEEICYEWKRFVKSWTRNNLGLIKETILDYLNRSKFGGKRIAEGESENGMVMTSKFIKFMSPVFFTLHNPVIVKLTSFLVSKNDKLWDPSTLMLLVGKNEVQDPKLANKGEDFLLNFALGEKSSLAMVQKKFSDSQTAKYINEYGLFSPIKFKSKQLSSDPNKKWTTEEILSNFFSKYEGSEMLFEPNVDTEGDYYNIPTGVTPISHLLSNRMFDVAEWFLSCIEDLNKERVTNESVSMINKFNHFDLSGISDIFNSLVLVHEISENEKLARLNFFKRLIFIIFEYIIDKFTNDTKWHSQDVHGLRHNFFSQSLFLIPIFNDDLKLFQFFVESELFWLEQIDMVHTRGKGFEEFKLLKRQEKIAERKRFVKFICLRLKANKILEWLEEPQL